MSAARRAPLAGRLVGISLGNSEDLERLGYGPEHLDEAALRIARLLLQLGADLAYSGDLRAGGFLETFLTLVRSEESEDGPMPGTPRVISFQPWPRSAKLTPAWIADRTGLCRYVAVDPALPPGTSLQPYAADVSSPRQAWQLARGLSAMREVMQSGTPPADGRGQIRPLDARILLGGRREGFNGLMPGIAEEALLALQVACPLYVIGGFGGGARLVADALVGGEWPAELTLAHHLRVSAKFRLTRAGYLAHDAEGAMEARYGALQEILAQVRRDRLAGLSNGLGERDNRALMRTEDLPRLLKLMAKGLRRRFAEAP